MPIDISAGFPPGLATPDLIALAEDLGFARAWVYDSPALYHDVWVTLARAAERTERIGLGPGVLVPSLRHPMVNAAAIATLVDLAPGRVAVAIGAGFTGRHVLGQKPMRWADVRTHVLAIRGLLRGDEVAWDGKSIRMVHPQGFGAPRPIDVPILIGADGPKGTAVADELGDGTFAAGVPNAAATHAWRALLSFGTVLDAGETTSSPRVIEAAGPGVAVVLHGLYERGGPAVVDTFPGGPAWRTGLEEIDEAHRHLATHEGHLVELTPRDRAGLEGGLSELIGSFTLTAPASEIAERIDALAAQGITELAYQPCGPDIPRELDAFAAAAAAASSTRLGT
jgi:5,10-methylenetetrahydromethanopterin reductase